MFDGMTRRHFLKHAAGAAAFAASAGTFVRELRAAAPELKKQNKSLIIFWMGGGPSHMDLWDLKPDSNNGGEFKPIKTNADGIQISEVLPSVAGVMDKLSIIRSLQSNEGSHERGTTLMNTGRLPNPVVAFPHVGAIASSMLASKDLALPGFVGIGGTAQRVGSGFLGMANSPFTVQNAGQPPANVKPPDSLGNDEEKMQRVRRRQRLFYTVEDNFTERVLPGSKAGSDEHKTFGDAADAHEAVYKKAFDLTVSPLRTIFEVRSESTKIKDEYGGEKNQFGMGCLLARKLVEKGVTAVEVDLGGWDNHGGVFNAIRTGNGPRLDKGIAGLVKDLNDRGLWQNTVVLWAGEFGRTPRINQGGGRDHWGRCWSVVVGGGGIKGGMVYGATNKDGDDIKEGKVGVADLFATVYKGLGLDPTTRIRDNLGRPLPLASTETNEAGKVIESLIG